MLCYFWYSCISPNSDVCSSSCCHSWTQHMQWGFQALFMAVWLAFQEEGRKLLEYLLSQLNLRSEGFTFSHCSWLLAWLFRTKGGSQWSTCHRSSARPVYAARVLVTVYGCLLGFAKRKGGSCLSTRHHSWICAVTVSVLLHGWRNEWTAAGDVDKIKQI